MIPKLSSNPLLLLHRLQSRNTIAWIWYWEEGNTNETSEVDDKIKTGKTWGHTASSNRSDTSAKLSTEHSWVWADRVKLKSTGAHPLFTGASYRSKTDAQTSLLELRRAAKELRKHAKKVTFAFSMTNFPILIRPEINRFWNQTARINKCINVFLKILTSHRCPLIQHDKIMFWNTSLR